MAETKFNLKFKYGLEENLYKKTNGALDVPIENGTIYVTKDKHSIFCDLDSTRFRIGDYVRKYSTLTELKQDAPSWYQNSLVFIENGNILAIYDETENQWIQINDTSTLSEALNERIDTVAGNLEKEIERSTEKDEGHDSAIAALEGEVLGLKDFNQQIPGIYATIEQLQTEIERSTSKDSEHNSAISTLQTNLANEIKRSTDKDDDHDAAIVALQTLTDGFTNDSTIKGYVDGQFTEKLNPINESINTLKQKDIDLNGEISALKQKDIDLDDEISVLKQKDTGYEASINALQQEDIKHNDEINTLKQKDTGHDSEIAGLKNRIGVIEGFNIPGTYATKQELTDAKNNINATIDAFQGEVENEFTSVRSEINTQMQTADAMTFKGVLSATTEANNITYLALPTTGVQKGDTYKVSKNGAIIDVNNLIIEQESITVRVGDLIIAGADQIDQEQPYEGGWYHISSGYEDDYNAYFEGESNYNKLNLKGGAGEDKGSITFSSISNNIKITMTDSSSNPELAFNLVWDTF